MQKGSSTIIVIVIIALVAIGGAVAYWAMSDSNDNGAENNTTSETNNQEGQADDAALIQDGWAGNATITCDYTIEGDSGSAYFKQGGDYSLEQTGPDGSVRVIRLGDTIYGWTVGEGQGYQVSTNLFEEDLDEMFTVFSTENLEDTATTEDIDCYETAEHDPALFELPDDKDFPSIDHMYQE